MFKVINGITQINGQNGIYDGKIQNNSVRYARNAVDNYLKTYSPDADWFKNMPSLKGIAHADNDTFEKTIAQEKKCLDEMPSFEFNLKYANNEAGKPDKMAVMAFAYEEMGKKDSVSVDELTQTLQSGLDDEYKNSYSAESLDLNKDGKIDVAEYGTSILVEDMLSSDTSKLDANNITGEITDKGQNALIAFAAKNNYNSALETYKSVHDAFNLNQAQKEFLGNKNNLIA